MTRDELTELLTAASRTLAQEGFDVRPLIVADPATRSEVADLESALGFSLPESFRHALLTISRHVEFRWFAPDATTFDAPFRDNFSGDLHWSLSTTAQIVPEARSWIDTVFPNPDDPYDAVWHDKAAFYDVGNGDYIALDLTDARRGSIVYLSHDDGEGHGHVLASDFSDLLDRWVPLACTGGEDWQWAPFTSGLTSMIEPHGQIGDLWRQALGLESLG